MGWFSRCCSSCLDSSSMNVDSFRAFLLALFILAIMVGIQSAHAAYSAVPAVAGYSASTGTYSAAAGSFAANASSYGATGVVNVGGKAVTVPATLRMASNAGQYAKSAMRLNPWLIAGTLALPWLIDQGMEYINDQWVINKSGKWVWKSGNFISPVFNTPAEACQAYAVSKGDNPAYYSVGPNGGACTRLGSIETNISTYEAATGNTLVEPATPLDWENLPDPLPVVAPELPYAPYMPNGAPVEAPEYDFAPFSQPIGMPYSKPDESTAQPMARISPNGDSVTVDTYDQPLTDSTGAPVPPNTPPVDVSPTLTDCDKYPKSIGCSEYGTPDLVSSDVIPTNQISVSTGFTPVGGAGTCPADVQLSFMGQTIPWSYSPICDFATMIRPLIIGFAWLSFGFTVISGFRKAG